MNRSPSSTSTRTGAENACRPTPAAVWARTFVALCGPTPAAGWTPTCAAGWARTPRRVGRWTRRAGRDPRRAGRGFHGGLGADRAAAGADYGRVRRITRRAGRGLTRRAGRGLTRRAGRRTHAAGWARTRVAGGATGSLGADSRGGLGAELRRRPGRQLRGGLGADLRAWGANRVALDAPVSSSDGQATIYNRKDALADTATGTLQALGAIPTVPAWLTPVGQAYRFVATQPLPRTIGFNYLQREVPPGYEHTLQIYYSPDEGATWRLLPTQLDVNENLATAPADESGLYMLAGSIDIPFYTAGWNLFAYPVPETRPVRTALASIAGHYSTVFTYNNRDSADPWKVFEPSAPDWVNDLKTLEYGNGYWVNVSVPITLQIKVASDSGGERPTLSLATPTFSDALGRRNPPGVYYGTIQGVTDPTLARSGLHGRDRRPAMWRRQRVARRCWARQRGPAVCGQSCGGRARNCSSLWFAGEGCPVQARRTSAVPVDSVG